MVTAELAACLPVLVLLLAVALSAVSVADLRIRTEDAAHEAARALARGDAVAARRLASQELPGVRLATHATGGEVVAVTTMHGHLLASWLPSITVTGRAVAALEPSSPP